VTRAFFPAAAELTLSAARGGWLPSDLRIGQSQNGKELRRERFRGRCSETVGNEDAHCLLSPQTMIYMVETEIEVHEPAGRRG
jgi:hypothetical protein